MPSECDSPAPANPKDGVELQPIGAGSPRNPATFESPSINSKRIIVVDDDVDIGTMLVVVLSKHYSYVMHCKNRKEALTELNRELPALIICDVYIGAEDGRDLCREIRKDAGTMHIPVLMISAVGTTKDGCIAAGANGFLVKPFGLHDFLTTVAETLR